MLPMLSVCCTECWSLAEALAPFLFLFMFCVMTADHSEFSAPYLVSLPTEEPWLALLSGAF